MSVNKVILIGRLGQDPDIRYTKSGTGVANFSLATDQVFKDSAGQRQQSTEWHQIVAWKKLSDFVATFLKKGREVYIEGRLQTRSWTDKENVKHYKTEVVANVVQFVGPAPKHAGDPQPGDGAGADPGEYMEDDIPA